jgi:hypothetical protein
MIAMIVITAMWLVAMLLLVLGVRTRRRAIVCPISGKEVRVRFLESVPRGRPIEVTACSAFMPSSAVTCDQPCLGLLAHPVVLADGEQPCSRS